MKDIRLKKVDLLLTNGYILTMNSKREIIKDGAIAIKGEEIMDIGSTKKLLSNYISDNVKDLKGVLVHPGLIDAHAHTAMHLIRSFCSDTMDSEEMFEKFEIPYFKNVSAEDEYYGTMLACMEMVLNGTTTFGDTGSATGRVENWRATESSVRFQFPPHQTQHADFPHCAFLLTSPKGLFDLSAWQRFQVQTSPLGISSSLVPADLWTPLSSRPCLPLAKRFVKQ